MSDNQTTPRLITVTATKVEISYARQRVLSVAKDLAGLTTTLNNEFGFDFKELPEYTRAATAIMYYASAIKEVLEGKRI